MDLSQSDNSVSLDTQPGDGSLSLSPQGTAPTYSPAYTQNKASQYQIALSPDVNVPHDQLYGDVENGLTQDWDHVLAQREQIRQNRDKNDFLQQLVTNRQPGAMPTQEEMSVVDSLTQDEMHAPELPVILSRRYADMFTNAAMQSQGNSVFDRANQTHPVGTLDVTNATADWVQRANLANDAYEMYKQRYDSAGLASNSEDFVKSLIPGFQWLTNRGAQIDGAQSSLLTGEDQANQISYLYTLSPTDFKNTLSAKLEDLYKYSPAAAADFAQKVISFSRSDRIMGNIQDVGDAATLAAAALNLGRSVAQHAAEKGFEATPGSIPGLGGPSSPSGTPEVPGASPGAAGAVPPGAGSSATAAASETAPVNARVTFPGTNLEAPIDVPSQNVIQIPGQKLLTSDQKLLGGAQRQLAGPIVPDSAAHPLGSLEIAGRKIVSASVNDPSDVAKIAGELGAHEESAVIDATQNMQQNDPTGYETMTQQKLADRLPTAMDPFRGFEETESHAGASKGRLSEAVLDAQNSPIIQNAMRVDRLTGSQFSNAAQEAFASIGRTFTSLAHNVIDAETLPAELDPATNLYRASVFFGNKDGTLFKSPEAAQQFANRFLAPKTGDIQIVQHGAGGWAAKVTKPVSEIDGIRGADIESGLQTPDVLTNRGILGKARSPDYQLAQPVVNQRARAVHAAEWFGQQISEFTDQLQSLSKIQRDNLNKVFTENRVNRNWYYNQQDFFKSYIQRTGAVPTAKEWDAYEQYVKTYDTDYVVRNNSLITQMSVKGGQGIEIGKDVAFNGKVLENGRIPWELAHEKKGQFSIQIWNDNGKPEKEYFSNYLLGQGGDETRQLIDKRLADGYRVVLEPEKAKYHIVKNFRRSEITGDQLGYNPGGHIVYNSPYFVKTPKITYSSDGSLARYEGDTVLFNAPTHAHAIESAKLLDEGRRLILSKNPNASQFFRDKLAGVMDLKNFMSAVSRGDIDLRHPILGVISGERTINVGNWTKNVKGFYSSVTSPHNIFSDVRAQFMGEQAKKILDVVKAENGALVKTGIEPLLNPFEALAKSNQSMADLQIMNDLRISAANNYAQEFGHLHSVDPNLIRNNPLHYMQNPQWADGVNPVQKAAAQRYANRMMELTGFKSSDELEELGLRSAVNDWAMERWGPEGRKAMTKPLALIKNPGHYLRAAVFHPTLGMFNPAQFLKQASEFAKAIAVSPIHGVKAMPSVWLQRWALATDDPAILNHIANTFGWALNMPKQDWLKMVYEMKRSGFSIVGHDVANLDASAGSSVGSGLNQALHTGSVFFREGDLVSRMTAWQVGYREALEKHGSNLDRYQLTAVLQRAKNITTNMQRDSNASWQKGAFGVTTQWLPYHTRMMEQMFDGGIIGNGRKFTAAEKARMVLTNTALYGIRGALGMFGIPGAAIFGLYEAYHNLYSDDPSYQLAKSGLVSLVYQALTGEKGDFSSYGPSGLQPLSDLITGDKTLAEILAGVAGGKLGTAMLKTWGAAGNLISDMSDAAQGKGNIRVTTNDLLEPLQEITAINSARILWQVTNTQKWISKSGGYLKNNATVTEALTNFIAGVQPQEITDTFNKQNAVRTMQGWQRESQQTIRTLISKSIRSQNEGDLETANTYRQRAAVEFYRSDLPLGKYNEAVTQGINDVPMTVRGADTYNMFMLKRQMTSPSQNNFNPGN